MLLIAWLSLLIWLVLLFARGGFWRAQAVLPLSESTVHAVGQAE
ncbi:MAG: glycosyl transferase family 2, partial [Caballeronia sp.]